MTALLAYTVFEDCLLTRFSDEDRVPGKPTEPQTTQHPVLVPIYLYCPRQVLCLCKLFMKKGQRQVSVLDLAETVPRAEPDNAFVKRFVTPCARMGRRPDGGMQTGSRWHHHPLGKADGPHGQGPAEAWRRDALQHHLLRLLAKDASL